MPIAYWCVLAAAILPILLTGIAKAGGPGFNNARPRDFVARDIAAFRKRAYWAHLNGLEAFAPFAAGVVIAGLRGADPAWLDGLALTFIAARVVYSGFYIADWASARSFAWMVALGCVVGLFVIAAQAG